MPTKASSTRATILERAVQIASTEGLEGLTIGRLAEDTSMSKSGLFAHFGSKQELQLATVMSAGRRFYEEVLTPAFPRPEGWPRLRAYCENYLAFLQAEVFAGGCFWAAAAAEFDDRPGPVRDAVRQGIADWLAELERQARIARAKDPRSLAFEIYSIGLGANSYSRLLADEHAFARAREMLERSLVQHGSNLDAD